MQCSIVRGATMAERQYSMQRYKVGTRSQRPQEQRTMSENIARGSEMTGSSSPSALAAAVRATRWRDALGLVRADRLAPELGPTDLVAGSPEKPLARDDTLRNAAPPHEEKPSHSVCVGGGGAEPRQAARFGVRTPT